MANTFELPSSTPQPALKVADKLARVLRRVDPKIDPISVQKIVHGVVLEAKVQGKASFDRAFEDDHTVELTFGKVSTLTPYLNILKAVVDKKDACSPNPLLDNILTILFVAELVYVVCGYYQEGNEELIGFLICFVLAGVFVEATKYSFGMIGDMLSRAVAAAGMVDSPPLKARTQMKKWKEQVSCDRFIVV